MSSRIAWARSIGAVGAAWGFGDILCQRIEHGATGEHNTKRTLDFVLVGGLILGPANHGFELWVERMFPGTTLMQICKKVVTRVVIAPGFLTLSFASVAFIRSEDIKSAVLHNVFPAWCTGSLFWPAASAFAYRFIPLEARPAFGSCLGALWSTYLSFMAHREIIESPHLTTTLLSPAPAGEPSTTKLPSTTTTAAATTAE